MGIFSHKKFRFMVVFVLGMAVGLGVNYLRLLGERKALRSELAEVQGDAESLQKRYAEKKTMETQLLRARASAEGQKRAIQAEAEKLEKDLSAAQAEKDGLSQEKKRLEARIAALETSVKDLGDANARAKAEREESEKKHAQDAKDRQNELAQLRNEKAKVESDLKGSLEGMERRLEQYRNQNAKLCTITTELLEKYKNKGLVKSVLQAEPFTQLQQVEVEKIIDEYKTRIEENKLDKRSKSPKK